MQAPRITGWPGWRRTRPRRYRPRPTRPICERTSVSRCAATPTEPSPLRLNPVGYSLFPVGGRVWSDAVGMVPFGIDASMGVPFLDETPSVARLSLLRCPLSLAWVSVLLGRSFGCCFGSTASTLAPVSDGFRRLPAPMKEERCRFERRDRLRVETIRALLCSPRSRPALVRSPRI